MTAAEARGKAFYTNTNIINRQYSRVIDVINKMAINGEYKTYFLEREICR